jgi:hypothetical protein
MAQTMRPSSSPLDQGASPIHRTVITVQPLRPLKLLVSLYFLAGLDLQLCTKTEQDCMRLALLQYK